MATKIISKNLENAEKEIKRLIDENTRLKKEIDGLKPENPTNMDEFTDLYKTLFESNIVGIAISDKSGNLIANNTALENILGYSKAELLKINLKDLYVNKADRNRLISLLEEKGRIENFEAKLFKKNGAEYWINLNSKIIKMNENEVLLNSVLDISARKRIEQQLIKSAKEYKQLLELSPLGIAVYDISGNYLYVNPAYCRIFLRKEEELIGKNYIYINIPRENQGMEIESFIRLINSKTGITPFNTENIRGDKKRITVHYFGDYTRDMKGNVTGLVVFCEDITKTLQMEEQLHKSEKMQAIGQLAGGIAHDFNNYLAIISGYSEMLKGVFNSDSESAKYLDIIIESTENASDLTDKLLAFARKGKDISVNVNINKLLENVIELLTYSLDKNIVIKKELVDGKPVTVGDPSQLQNMVLNLAFNSRDAMNNSGELIFKTDIVVLDKEYCSTYKTEPGNYIQLCIKDTGRGIEKETLKHAFEPFFTTKDFGVGMGLPAVYGIVKNHKGIINIESEVDKGTECIIYLPLTKTKKRDKQKHAKYNKRDLSGAHIMIIDDEMLICNMLKNILSREAYKVSAFQDGYKAIEEYKRVYKEIDLVIIDMIMPEINGKEVFLEMKKMNPSIKALLSSGYSVDGQIQDILDIGISDFLQKPYKRTDMLKKISDILTLIS
jgi:PAS domain S-box-containing protein